MGVSFFRQMFRCMKHTQTARAKKMGYKNMDVIKFYCNNRKVIHVEMSQMKRKWQWNESELCVMFIELLAGVWRYGSVAKVLFMSFPSAFHYFISTLVDYLQSFNSLFSDRNVAYILRSDFIHNRWLSVCARFFFSRYFYQHSFVRSTCSMPWFLNCETLTKR